MPVDVKPSISSHQFLKRIVIIVGGCIVISAFLYGIEHIYASYLENHWQERENNLTAGRRDRPL